MLIKIQLFSSDDRCITLFCWLMRVTDVAVRLTFKNSVYLTDFLRGWEEGSFVERSILCAVAECRPSCRLVMLLFY